MGPRAIIPCLKSSGHNSVQFSSSQGAAINICITFPSAFQPVNNACTTLHLVVVLLLLVSHVLDSPSLLLRSHFSPIHPFPPLESSIMSSPPSSVRHRGPHKDKPKANGKIDTTEDFLDKAVQSTKQAITSQWDFKLALGIITFLAFVTRFWGISHPDEVVFDEVHFGKVRKSSTSLPATSTDYVPVRILLLAADIFL